MRCVTRRGGPLRQAVAWMSLSTMLASCAGSGHRDAGTAPASQSVATESGQHPTKPTTEPPTATVAAPPLADQPPIPPVLVASGGSVLSLVAHSGAGEPLITEADMP